VLIVFLLVAAVMGWNFNRNTDNTEGNLVDS